MRASLCLVLMLLGCDQLFGRYVEPNPQNCATSGSACGSGQACNLATGRCETAGGGSGPPVNPGAVCDPGGFCWENTLPQGNDLYRACARSLTDVWFVGAFGTILHCEVRADDFRRCLEFQEDDESRRGSIPQGAAAWPRATTTEHTCDESSGSRSGRAVLFQRFA